jgi:Spy/CpxP family protein refolding chaperone
MLKVMSTVLAVVASLVVVGGLLAADAPKETKDKQPRPQFDPIEMMLRGVTLSDAQKAKVEALKKEYAPKFKAAFEKHGDFLTQEQKKAMEEARAAHKDPRETWKSLKLTDAQKAKMEEGRKAMQALQKEVKDKVMNLLTPAQKKQLKKAHGKHKGGPEGGPGGPEGGPGGPGGPEGGPGGPGGPGDSEGGPRPHHGPDSE